MGRGWCGRWAAARVRPVRRQREAGWRPGALGAAAIVLLGACGQDRPPAGPAERPGSGAPERAGSRPAGADLPADAFIPELRAPPPLSLSRPAPGPATFRIVAEGVRARTATGVEAEAGRVEAVYVWRGGGGGSGGAGKARSAAGGAAAGPGTGRKAATGRPGAAAVHLRRLRLEAPRLTFPVDTIQTGLDLFFPIPGPGVRVDTLEVAGGEAGTLAHPSQHAGRWLWRLEGIALAVRGLRLGGPGGPEGLRLVRGEAAGEIRGRAIRIAGAELGVARTRDRLEFRAAARLGSSRVRLGGGAERTGAWAVDARVNAARFSDLRAILPRLPETGWGAAELRAEGRGGRGVLRVREFRAGAGLSRVAGRGRLGLGPAALEAATLEVARLRSADLERVLGRDVPIDGEVAGRLHAVAAPGGGGDLLVAGSLEHRAEPGALPSRLGFGGRVGPGPDRRLELRLDGHPVRVGEAAVGLTLEAAGPASGLALRGELRAEGVAAALDGRVALEPEGELSVRLRADSVPLEKLPLPGGVQGVAGVGAAVLVVDGTLPAPELRGRAEVRDGAATVRPPGVRVEGVSAAMRLAEGVLALERVEAGVGGGRVRGSGRAELGPRWWTEEGRRALRFELDLEADDVRILDRADGRLAASGTLAVRGTPEAPRLDGRIFRLRGWIREDAFREDGPLDPADPPYASLAREAPWPEDSRLRAARSEAPGWRGQIEVEVGSELRVVDEDSELRGHGLVVVEAGERGVEARGTLAADSGFYASFGRRFHVVGGVVRFDGGELDPRVSIRAEYRDGAPLGSGLGAVAARADRFPPLWFLARGRASALREELRGPGPRPEAAERLAELLIYGVEPEPVTGWRQERLWRPGSAAELFGERAEAQALPLVWSYAADEGYDFVPLGVGYLQAGMITVGGRWPSRTVVGPLLRGAAVLGRRAEVLVSQAADGGIAPGVRLRLGVGAGSLELFDEPRFFAAPALGLRHPGFTRERRRGATVRWSWEF